jgi:type VI protein secretion system component VasF
VTTAEREELEHLRARVAALEAERHEELRRAGEAVAAYQERVYWLDRWHLDLNALMARPGAAEFRAAVRAVRAVIRRVRLLKRRLLG